MFLLVPAHPGCPGQNPKSRKTVVCVCVCLYAIASKRIEYPIILDIFIHYNNLHSKNQNLIFCWIPSHRGIAGNSRAEQEAKLALNSTVKPLPIPASDFNPYIKQFFNLEWQKPCNLFPNNKLYKSQFQPFIHRSLERSNSYKFINDWIQSFDPFTSYHQRISIVLSLFLSVI